jgi:hypothetical protein
MYVIVPRERHPDKFLGDEAYGPYTSFEEAMTEADILYMHENNKHATGHKKYDYIVIQLVSLQKV